MKSVDDLKAKRMFFEAGVEAYTKGQDMSYGVHFGMRSSRNYAISEFERGYKDAMLQDRLTKV